MIGQTLAHYEITALLGRGGMGEVYRARDTRLGRDVALKLLPPEFADDRERLARFRREARTLASLNHPHIAAIHGLEEDQGKVFLAMELIEGEDLAERLRRGSIPVAEAIDLARQLVEGLREAHEKGIVHRDLKPANLKVTPDGTLKILDFGLARAWQGDEDGEEDLQNSPTITAAMTHQGVILGTAAYMSPEQARGRKVDQRADVWAFGAIVWELLTGRQLFEGESVSDTLAAVLRAEPEEAALPADTPPAIRSLLHACLERDRRRRLQHIGDARLFLEGELGGVDRADEGPRSGAGPWRLVALGLGAACVALIVFALRPTTQGPTERPREVRRWSFVPEPGASNDSELEPAISPDGRRIAFVTQNKLWIRDVAELAPRPLEGTDGAELPFWSPDGEWLGFTVERRILRIPRSGGQATPIGAHGPGVQPSSSGSVTWDDEGRIVIGTGMSGLYHVPTAGATAEVLLATGPETTDFHEVGVVPGGRGWIFVVHRSGGDYDRLDYLGPDGEHRMLLELAGTNLRHPVVDASAGHLLFHRAGLNEGIWAVALALDPVEVTGSPFLVAADGHQPSVSDDGTLVYQLGGQDRLGELAWLDREGRSASVLAEVSTTRPFPTLSANGATILMCVSEEQQRDIWSFDAASGLGRRLDSTEASEEMAVFSPGDDFVYFYTSAAGGFSIRRFPRNVPTETEELVLGIMPHPRPDLGGLFYAHQKPSSFDFDLAFLPFDADASAAEPRILVESPAIDWWPVVSPDGAFLLFMSNESGRYEVYLTSLPDARGRWKVSADGGQFPQWRADGREIYYADSAAIYAVDFDAEGGVRIGAPRRLFTYDANRWSSEWENGFGVDPTGERFLVVQHQAGEDIERPQVVVVENWAAEFAGP